MLGDPDSVEQSATSTLEPLLRELGPIRAGRLAAGEAYGVPLDVLYWLVGPIDQTQTPLPA